MSSLGMPYAPIDDHSTRIMRSAMCRPMSAVQISHSSGVPVAVAFRRIRQLVAAGMLREELRVVNTGGKEIPLYAATLNCGYVFVEDGRLRIRLSMNADAPEASGAERML